jgi:hypothetical protein
MERTNQATEKFLLIFGMFLIILGIIFNEWLITQLLCPQGELEYRSKLVIRIIEILMIVMGASIIIFRKKDFTINFSILLVTLIILFLGIEIFFRAFLPQIHGKTDNFFAYDSSLGWKFIPNETGHYVSRHEFRTKITINSDGMRDREYSLAKDSGRKRVAVLGDSFVSTLGVPYEETSTTLLETKLKNSEVLNFGVNGYGPIQYFLLLQKKAIHYSPDLVIMVIYIGNDLYDLLGISTWIDGYARPKALIDDQGQLHITNIPVPISEKLRAMKQMKKRCKLPGSHFITFINKIISHDKYAIDTAPPELKLCKKNIDPDIKDAYRLMEVLLKEADNYCRNHGIKFMVAIAPTIVQACDYIYWKKIIQIYDLKSNDYDLDLPNKLLEKMCQKEGIPVIDLTPALKSRIDDGIIPYYLKNQHWNKEGEQLVAETIACFITDKKLL